MTDPYATRTGQERKFLDGLEVLALASHQTRVEQFSNFTAWTPRQNIARFMVQDTIYQRILGVHGLIVEGGIGDGAGLFGWAHLAAILEPYNYTRKVVGFDLGVHPAVQSDLERLAKLHDLNRPLGHLKRIEFVWGDAAETIPEYMGRNKDLRIALLVLDFTKAAPTRAALKFMVPLMPKGGVVVTGGIWPEEMALLDPELRWERCSWSPTLCFAVKP